MTTPESNDRLKEAKAIQEKIADLIVEGDDRTRMTHTLLVIAGMLTETLLEYEEPDTVMEQTFHRIADMIKTEPADVLKDESAVPAAYVIDKYADLGRHIAREAARKLPGELDDVHEISIALILDYFPQWEEKGEEKKELFRVLIECVICALTFEMATQDFCDLLIEDFISEGYPVQQALMGLAALSGYYLANAVKGKTIDLDAGDRELTHVMAREALRHGTSGQKNWLGLGAVNDLKQDNVAAEYVVQLREPVEEFFDLIGMDEPLGRAVAVAKAAGRMVAVTTVDDIAHIQTSVAKTLARSGLVMGLKMGLEGST